MEVITKENNPINKNQWTGFKSNTFYSLAIQPMHHVVSCAGLFDLVMVVGWLACSEIN